MRKKKIILIQGLLAPYRYPIFAELAKNPNWEIEVWFMGGGVKNREWGKEALKKYKFKHRFLSGITFNFGIKDNYPFWFNPKIYSLLARHRPDAVIMMGWDSLTSFLAHVACRAIGIKFILYSDSTTMEKSWRRFITLPLVKLHVRSADTLISGGTRSRMYLEGLGAKPEKIYVSYNTVDVEKYQSLTNKFKKESLSIRQKLGVGSNKVIVYYAQFIERKGGDLLLLAYKKLKEKYKKITLLLIGSGPFRKNLEDLIKNKKIDDVIILDNPGDEEVCKYYAIANVFVLPSREDVWGLVVNEAMSSNLPVVVSDNAGSSADLVRNGYNGYTFKSGNVNDLYLKIENIIANNTLRERMASNSLELIHLYNPKLTVDKFSEAIEHVLDTQQFNISFLNRQEKNLLTVIIPVYKDEIGLQKTISSLNSQKFHNFKLEIIVDNDEHGTGSYKSRNRGIRHSKGEFIAFIDAGTVAAKGWLERGYKDLLKYDYVSGPIVVTRKKDSNIPTWLYLFGVNREFPVSEFMNDLHFGPTTNLFVRRSLIEKVGGFNSRLKSSGDYEFGDRIYRSGNFLQYYDPGLQVYHPARNYRSLIKKQKRLAAGLIDLGKLYPNRFPSLKFNFIKSALKAVCPPFWLFSKDSWSSLSFTDKIMVFVATYFFSFIQHTQAIQYGFLRAR